MTATPDEARWELAQREMHSIRADIANLRDALPMSAMMNKDQGKTLRPVSDDVKTPDVLRHFLHDVATFQPDEGGAIRWMWQRGDSGVVYVHEEEIGRLHIASRRALEAKAGSRNVRISVIPNSLEYGRHDPGGRDY